MIFVVQKSEAYRVVLLCTMREAHQTTDGAPVDGLGAQQR